VSVDEGLAVRDDDRVTGAARHRFRCGKEGPPSTATALRANCISRLRGS
jgi:hypothetical protein